MKNKKYLKDIRIGELITQKEKIEAELLLAKEFTEKYEHEYSKLMFMKKELEIIDKLLSEARKE